MSEELKPDQKSCRKNYSPLKNCRNDWNLEIFGIFEALLSEELMYTICSFSVLPHYPGRNSTTRMKKNVSRSSRVARFLSDLLASSAFFPGQLKAQFQICLASFYVLLKKGYGKLGQENSKFLAADSKRIWPVFAKLVKKLAKKLASWQPWGVAGAEEQQQQQQKAAAAWDQKKEFFLVLQS